VLELKHLRLLRELVEHGTLSAAARCLGYSQPAVTQQLQGLERSLGTPLVVRSRSGISLTEAGEVLLRHGRTALSSLSLAEAEVAAVAGLRSGRIRLACFPSAAGTILPPALASVAARHPGLSFSLTEAEPPEALALLDRGECDVVVAFAYDEDTKPKRPGSTADEVWIPLLRETVHVALAHDHPAATTRHIRLSDLRDERWIAGCPKCRGHLVAACQAAGFEPDIAFETDDYVALQGLAAAGLGVALLPDLVLSVVRLDTLDVRRLHPAQCRTVSAVSTPSLLRVPGVRQTIDALHEASRAMRLPKVSA
jgi:DNA-binding transcriptional LysR family regulator